MEGVSFSRQQEKGLNVPKQSIFHVLLRKCTLTLLKKKGEEKKKSGSKKWGELKGDGSFKHFLTSYTAILPFPQPGASLA